MVLPESLWKDRDWSGPHPLGLSRRGLERSCSPGPEGHRCIPNILLRQSKARRSLSSHQWYNPNWCGLQGQPGKPWCHTRTLRRSHYGEVVPKPTASTGREGRPCQRYAFVHTGGLMSVGNSLLVTKKVKSWGFFPAKTYLHSTQPRLHICEWKLQLTQFQLNWLNWNWWNRICVPDLNLEIYSLPGTRTAEPSKQSTL